jgi:hypothetical protein
MGLRSALGRQGLRYGWVLGGAVVAAAENFEMCPGRQRQGRGRSVPSGFGHDRFGARRPADQDRRDRPGGHRVRGDDESPFIEAASRSAARRTATRRRRWPSRQKPGAGRPAKSMTLATTWLATPIDNVNREVLDHYMRALPERSPTSRHPQTNYADSTGGCSGRFPRWGRRRRPN